LFYCHYSCFFITTSTTRITSDHRKEYDSLLCEFASLMRSCVEIFLIENLASKVATLLFPTSLSSNLSAILLWNRVIKRLLASILLFSLKTHTKLYCASNYYSVAITHSSYWIAFLEFATQFSLSHYPVPLVFLCLLLLLLLFVIAYLLFSSIGNSRSSR
jgi:hypothetical protein